MKTFPTLASLAGLALLIVGGLKISRQLGLDGLSTGYVFAFASGILLVARDLSRKDLAARLIRGEKVSEGSSAGAQP
ncbi:MAG: hypothetical protein EOO77_07340 [Oxalobacteraceae bacterium]|nr:MAG: hypothetical protein EOO77_07340 [Oxalobacteraceae bacterium]